MYLIQLKNYDGLAPWNRWNARTELKFDKKEFKEETDTTNEHWLALNQVIPLDGLDHTELKEIL